jgi:hypothetical protein
VNIPEIGELCSVLAVDAVNVQLRFDLFFESEIQRLLELVASSQSADTPQPLTQMAPRRLRVARFDLELLVAISTTVEEEFAVHALPLNAEFFSRTQATVGKQSRIRISVEQVPFTKEQSPWPINMQAT